MSVLQLAALKGVFTDVVSEQVTFVNAPLLAKDRGVDVGLATYADAEDYRNLVTVRGVLPTGEPVSVSGTLTGPKQVEKLTEVDGFDVDLRLEGHLLFFRYHDRPGVVGVVGARLGDAGRQHRRRPGQPQPPRRRGADGAGRGQRGAGRRARPASPRRSARPPSAAPTSTPTESGARHRRTCPWPTATGRRLPSTAMRLAVIPGDGIGPEVVAEGLKVLREVVSDVETTTYDLGAGRWHRTGELIPDSVISELRGQDAILLGAVGDPSVPPGVLERGLLLRLRFELDHHVNLRPVRLFPGVRSPLGGNPAIDMVVVREGTEGPYSGAGGALRKDTPQEVATEISVNTAYGVERVVRDAFRRAAGRERRHLTLVHKTNVLTHSGSLWSRKVEEVSREHPDVTVAYQHVDAAVHVLRVRPRPGSTWSSPTTSSATSSPTSAPRSPAASGWPPAATSTSAGPTRACSSRCTAARRTSPAPGGPTRPRPCCRWRCCSTTSATATRPGGWRRRSPSTWPPATTPTPAGPRRSGTGSRR